MGTTNNDKSEKEYNCGNFSVGLGYESVCKNESQFENISLSGSSVWFGFMEIC